MSAIDGKQKYFSIKGPQDADVTFLLCSDLRSWKSWNKGRLDLSNSLKLPARRMKTGIALLSQEHLEKPDCPAHCDILKTRSLRPEHTHTKGTRTWNRTQVQQTHTKLLKQFQTATLCTDTHTPQTAFYILKYYLSTCKKDHGNILLLNWVWVKTKPHNYTCSCVLMLV